MIVVANLVIIKPVAPDQGTILAPQFLFSQKERILSPVVDDPTYAFFRLWPFFEVKPGGVGSLYGNI